LKQEPRQQLGISFSSLIWECSFIVNLRKRSKHFKNTKHTQISADDDDIDNDADGSDFADTLGEILGASSIAMGQNIRARHAL